MNSDNMKDILAKVETMELPEGAYLQFANMMKEQFDKKDKTAIEPYNIKIINKPLVTFIGKKNIEIILLKIEEYRSTADVYHYTMNGDLNISKHFINDLIKYHNSNLTTNIEIPLKDNVVIETSYIEYEAYVVNYRKSKHKLMDNDNYDDDFDFNMHYIMSIMLGFDTL